MKNNAVCTVETKDENETLEFGKYIGSLVKPGDTICLTGDLGSGKTVVSRGIARGLGINDDITSPSFTLLNVYEGAIPLYHFDVYRLDDESMVQDLGFYDYVGGDGVAVIEWADLVTGVLPDSYVLLDIKRDFESGNDIRLINVYENGADMKDVVDGIGKWRKINDNIGG